MTRLILLAAVLAAACQQAPAADAPAATPAEPKPMIVGGYAPANTADHDLTLAQKMAVDEVYKREPQRSIVEKVTPEVQVVAGLNYRFTIEMSGPNAYRVVVFKPLQGPMQVSQFEKLPAN